MEIARERTHFIKSDKGVEYLFCLSHINGPLGNQTVERGISPYRGSTANKW